MAKYVYVYKGGGVPASEQEQQQAMAAWGAFLGQLGDSLVDAGNPFGPSKSIASDGALGDGAPSALTGYSIVTAGSLDEAAAKARGCPALQGGGSVEVYETFDVM